MKVLYLLIVLIATCTLNTYAQDTSDWSKPDTSNMEWIFPEDITTKKEKKKRENREKKTRSEYEVLNKKGINVIPEKGDMAFGIGALPIINFAGNLFNISQYRNTLLLGYAGDTGVFYAKYYIQDRLAIRFKFKMNNMSTTQTNLVTDDLTTFFKAEDEYIYAKSDGASVCVRFYTT